MNPRQIVREAILHWSQFNQSNNSRVRFQEVGLLDQGKLRFQLGPQTDPTVGPVAGRIVSWQFSGTTLTDALVGLDLDNAQAPNGWPPGTKWYDCATSATGFAHMLRAVLLHEVGHTMGLAHVQSNPAAGATVMNGTPCVPNDSCGWMPETLSDCEKNVINSYYPSEPECESPNCPGGTCGDSEIDEGEECDDGNLTEGDGCNSQCQEENGNPPGQNCGSIGYELSFYTYSNCFAMCQAGDDHYNECLGSWASDICGGLFFFDLPGECSDEEFHLDQLFGVMHGGAPIHLQAENGLYFVAEGNGGGAVNADRPNPGQWETFTILDLNGGQLQDGDPVAVRTGSLYYFQAVGGGGGALQAIGQDAWAWETFTIINVSSPGGLILDESYIALAGNNGQFVCAEGGGGGTLNVNRNSIGGWETFRIRVN